MLVASECTPARLRLGASVLLSASASTSVYHAEGWERGESGATTQGLAGTEAASRALKNRAYLPLTLRSALPRFLHLLHREDLAVNAPGASEHSARPTISNLRRIVQVEGVV